MIQGGLYQIRRDPYADAMREMDSAANTYARRLRPREKPDKRTEAIKTGLGAAMLGMQLKQMIGDGGYENTGRAGGSQGGSSGGDNFVSQVLSAPAGLVGGALKGFGSLAGFSDGASPASKTASSEMVQQISKRLGSKDPDNGMQSPFSAGSGLLGGLLGAPLKLVGGVASLPFQVAGGALRGAANLFGMGDALPPPSQGFGGGGGKKSGGGLLGKAIGLLGSFLF